MVIFFFVRAFFCVDAFSDGDDVNEEEEEEEEEERFLLLVPRGCGRGKGKRDDDDVDDDDDDAVLPSNSMRGALARLFLWRESKCVCRDT